MELYDNTKQHMNDTDRQIAATLILQGHGYRVFWDNIQCEYDVFSPTGKVLPYTCTVEALVGELAQQ